MVNCGSGSWDRDFRTIHRLGVNICMVFLWGFVIQNVKSEGVTLYWKLSTVGRKGRVDKDHHWISIVLYPLTCTKSSIKLRFKRLSDTHPVLLQHCHILFWQPGAVLIVVYPLCLMALGKFVCHEPDLHSFHPWFPNVLVSFLELGWTKRIQLAVSLRKFATHLWFLQLSPRQPFERVFCLLMFPLATISYLSVPIQPRRIGMYMSFAFSYWSHKWY